MILGEKLVPDRDGVSCAALPLPRMQIVETTDRDGDERTVIQTVIQTMLLGQG